MIMNVLIRFDVGAEADLMRLTLVDSSPLSCHRCTEIRWHLDQELNLNICEILCILSIY